LDIWLHVINNNSECIDEGLTPTKMEAHA